MNDVPPIDAGAESRDPGPATPAGPPSGRLRAITVVAAVIGLVIATAVIGYFNFGSVLAAMRPIGVGGFLVVVVAQVALFGPLGFAWWLVGPEPLRRSPVFMWGRLMREAASDVLPFSQMGGIVIATRCALLGGVSMAAAFGSSVVDITLEIVAQLIFTLIGVALLVHRLGLARHDNPLLLPVLAGVVIAAVIVTAFIVTQNRGLHLFERMVERLFPAAAGGTRAVTDVIQGAYARPLRQLLNIAIHVGAWFGGAVGVWLICGFIGHPLPFLSVAAIESLLFAIRNAAFIVPSGLGIQEGAYAVIGPLFGLPAEAALALSLLKRARDVCIGLPSLLTWQFVESRRVLRRD